MIARLSWVLLATALAGGRLAAQAAVPAPAAPPAGAPAAGAPGAQPGDAPPSDDRLAPTQPRIRALAVAKWSAIAFTTAAALYGYHQNRLADARYEDLDRLCQTQPARCLSRSSSGAYTDAELESRFQEVRRLDHKAAVGLVGAEVGVAATVTLFLLDLRHASRKPPNIPYTPPKIQVVPGPRGSMELRVTTPVARR